MQNENTPLSGALVTGSKSQSDTTMFSMSQLRQSMPHLVTPNGPQSCHPENCANKTLAEYFVQYSTDFARLAPIKKEGWENPEGDTYWQDRREQSDKATEASALALFKMTQQIADEKQSKTSAFTPGDLGVQPFQSLDLCMAPGGFTWGSLKYNPGAIAYGITLPFKLGGYKNYITLPAEQVKYMDITMLASEAGVDHIPMTHPEHSHFLSERPFLDQRFQLIFCGGAVLRTHKRSDHRQDFEPTRLRTSQLILAMQRIIPGGTMVVLLRRPDAWDIFRLLHQFNSFSKIKLFKPYKKHNIKSTFYLVAKYIQPESEAAKAALEQWKQSWVRATFGGEQGTGEKDPEPDVEYVKKALDEFGPKLIKLAKPVWKIQADALERQLKRDFTTKGLNNIRKNQVYGSQKRN